MCVCLGRGERHKINVNDNSNRNSNTSTTTTTQCPLIRPLLQDNDRRCNLLVAVAPCIRTVLIALNFAGATKLVVYWLNESLTNDPSDGIII